MVNICVQEKNPEFCDISKKLQKFKIVVQAKISCFTVLHIEYVRKHVFDSWKSGENLPALPLETMNLLVAALLKQRYWLPVH